MQQPLYILYRRTHREPNENNKKAQMKSLKKETENAAERQEKGKNIAFGTFG